MPGVKERAVDLNGFIGGLNITAPPTEIKDNELVTCTNFYMDVEGQLKKRPGIFKVASSVGSAGLKKHIVGYFNARWIVHEIGTSNAWNIGASGPWTLAALTGSSASPQWLLTIQGICYVGFDANGVKILSGNAFGAAITNAPATSYAAAFHKDRLFATTIPLNRLAFSDPALPGTWQTNSTLDVGVDTNESITALVSFGDLLIIFMQNSTWSLYVQGNSPADWVLRKISGNIGCLFGDGGAWYYFNNEIYFISGAGIFKTNGASFKDIGRNIWIAEDPKYNAAYIYRVTRWNNNLLFIGSSATYGSFCFVYNLVTEGWSSWDFLGGYFDDAYAAVGAGENADKLMVVKNDVLYYFDNTNVFNYDTKLAAGFNSYADGFTIDTVGTGSAYTSTFQTKEFTSSVDEFVRSKWMGLEYIARASPTFKAVIDGVAGSAQTPGFHATLRKGYKMNGGGRGRTLALQGTHALTSPYEFYRASIHITSKVPILASGTP